MKEILVWYIRGKFTGSFHLTISHNSIAYSIAEWESRNRDTVIVNYMDENWNHVDTTPYLQWS